MFVPIKIRVTYCFSLQNFSLGFNIGDIIFLEGLENTGTGKINAGNITFTITAADYIWVDLLLIDPPMVLPPPPVITELSNATGIGVPIDIPPPELEIYEIDYIINRWHKAADVC